MIRKKMASIFVAALVGTVVLSGCGGNNASSSSTSSSADSSSSSKEKSGNDLTVTMYDSDGTTVLGTDTVAKGESYTPADPAAKDGYTFMGWYVTPEFSRKYDNTAALDKNTDLYAGFVRYQEDTRDFYILGNGKSDLLKKSNWGATLNDSMKLTKKESPDANVYTITLDLEEGDQLQFAVDSSWDDQRGFGYMKTIEQDGKEYFKNSGALGDANAKKANIEVKVAGNYTFTLTTYPSADYYDTDDSYYSDEKKENFNLNPYDTIEFTYNS